MRPNASVTPLAAGRSIDPVDPGAPGDPGDPANTPGDSGATAEPTPAAPTAELAATFGGVASSSPVHSSTASRTSGSPDVGPPTAPAIRDGERVDEGEVAKEHDGAEETEDAGEPTPPEPARLADLRTDRVRWLGREVEFVLQLEGRVDDWKPWITRFAPERYVGLRAWPDEVFLWKREAWLDPAPRLFARRGTTAAWRIGAAKRYARFRVRAVMREVFLDEPWIEILEAEPLREAISEGTILHAVRALEQIEAGSLRLAASELERASAPVRLPKRVRDELARLRELCR